MNFEKYTDRARGFVQSAQSLALREGHQQFGTEHLLKVLLDDPEVGRRAHRPVRRPLARGAGRCRGGVAKRPKVEGSGAGQLYMEPALARVFETAEKVADKAGDSFVTVERLLLALALEKDFRGRQDPGQGRGDAAESQCRDRSPAQGPLPPIRLPPRTPMTRSRNTAATSPRRRATASSIR